MNASPGGTTPPQTPPRPPRRDRPPKPPPLMGGLPAPPYPPGRRRWLADLAWLPGQGVCRDVLIEADGDRFTSVTPAAPEASATPPASPTSSATPAASPTSSVPSDAERLRGLTLPGFANAHSHAFHRALRGTTQA